jgi:hypothetical protein
MLRRVIAVNLGLGLAVLVMFVALTQGGAPGSSAATTVPEPKVTLDLARPTRARATVARPEATLTVQGPATSIPESFLGISSEYWSLGLFEEVHGKALARILSLLTVPGDGPLIVRVGGNSADRTFWDPSGHRLARWAYPLTPHWFRRTALMVRRVGARLIMDLNLASATPETSVRVAAAAERLLPPGSVIGFEVGNEPDLYHRAAWLAELAGAGMPSAERAIDLTPIGYSEAFDQYARLLAGIAPGVPLLGPALAFPRLDTDWISTLLANPHPALRTVSAHVYPYTACALQSSPQYPTIPRLLSANATLGLQGLIRQALSLARGAHLPLRLTELNSVSCGGTAGVSNSFATALWAPNALFELAETGVAGVNIHIRSGTVNAAFVITHHRLFARPLLYGLLLFDRTLGPDARLLRVHLHASRQTHLTAWAVEVGHGLLHVLLTNEGPRTVTVALALPSTATATVQRLLAPSIRARGGLTLDGQHLDSHGEWQGRPSIGTMNPGGGTYSLALPHASAALLSVPLDRTA